MSRRSQLIAACAKSSAPFSVGILALLTLGESRVSAAIVTSGVRLVEQGGTFDAGNVAASKHAFAPDIENPDPSGGWPSPDQPTGYGNIHNTDGTTNGIYGNGNGTWLAGSANSYLGVNLAGSFTVQSIAYGRDNLGTYPDRTLGLVTLQYTNDPSPGLSTSTWQTIGTMDYTTGVAATSRSTLSSVRHRFNFAPVTATAVQLVTASPGRGIDEFEVYSAAASTAATSNLAPNTSVVQDETTNASGLPFAGNPIPAEPTPGDGQYHHANGPGTIYWTPNLVGSNVKVEASWGVSFNHSLNVDYFFDPDGDGPLPEVALTQDLRQDRLADQTTTPANVEWSGFYEIASGLTLSAESTFRITGANVDGGSAPQALSSAVWRFTSVPEPTSLGFICIGALSALRRRRSA